MELQHFKDCTSDWCMSAYCAPTCVGCEVIQLLSPQTIVYVGVWRGSRFCEHIRSFNQWLLKCNGSSKESLTLSYKTLYGMSPLRLRMMCSHITGWNQRTRKVPRSDYLLCNDLQNMYTNERLRSEPISAFQNFVGYDFDSQCWGRQLQTYPSISVSSKIIHLRVVGGFLREIPKAQLTPNCFIWSGTYTTHQGLRPTVVEKLNRFSDRIIGSEPNTLAYLVFEETEGRNPDTLYLWELYSDQTGLTEVHAKSSAAAQLKDDIGSLLSDRVLQGYHLLK